MATTIEWFESKKSEIQSEILMTRNNEYLFFQKQCLMELRDFCSEIILNHKAIKEGAKYPVISDYVNELENEQEKIEQLLYGAKKCNFTFQSTFLEVKEQYIIGAVYLFRSLNCE